MTVRVHRVTEEELLARREAILRRLGLTRSELNDKVHTGGLVGDEWSSWSEIEDIDYLLEA
jgi:ribosomal protein S14